MQLLFVQNDSGIREARPTLTPGPLSPEKSMLRPHDFKTLALSAQNGPNGNNSTNDLFSLKKKINCNNYFLPNVSKNEKASSEEIPKVLTSHRLSFHILIIQEECRIEGHSFPICPCHPAIPPYPSWSPIWIQPCLFCLIKAMLPYSISAVTLFLQQSGLWTIGPPQNSALL